MDEPDTAHPLPVPDESVDTDTDPDDGEDGGRVELAELSEEDFISGLGELPKHDGEWTPRPLEIALETADGDVKVLKVSCRYPEDMEDFHIRYMEARIKAGVPEYDENGKPSFPGADKPNKLLRDELITEPRWLKNPSKTLRNRLPPSFWAELHRKLLLGPAGVDGDFFSDMAQLQTPKVSAVRLAASLRGSGSRRRKSSPAADSPPADSMQPLSPPTSDTTPSDESKNGGTASSTKSGSEAPSPPSVEAKRDPRPHPTPPSETSSENTPPPGPTSPETATSDKAPTESPVVFI